MSFRFWDLQHLQSFNCKPSTQQLRPGHQLQLSVEHTGEAEGNADDPKGENGGLRHARGEAVSLLGETQRNKSLED